MNFLGIVNIYPVTTRNVLYNRQLHQSEKDKLQQAANAIAASIGQNPADQATIAQYWNSMLTLAANADVDTQGQQQLTQYEAQLTQAAALSGNSQPLNTFIQDIQTAQGIVQSMQRQTLVGTTGNPIVADGSVVKSFQSTTAQANDTALLGNGPLGGVDTKNALGAGNTLATVGWQYTGNGTVQQQIQSMAQNSLQQASAPTDAVTPVYPEKLGLAYMSGGLASGALEAIAEGASIGVGSATNQIASRVLSNVADSQAARASSNFGQFSVTEGQLQESLGIWPPNSGGYSPFQTTLDVGTQLDRYGYPGGNFLSPIGTSFGERALPSYYETTKPYFQYEVLQSIPDVTFCRGMGRRVRVRSFSYPKPFNGIWTMDIWG